MARPKEFEPDEALDRAMRQFWAKGYHDTSIRDLVARTGVNYYGLYGEFENKRGLFMASLDRYAKIVTSEVVRELRRPAPLSEALRRTYERLLELVTTPDGRVGCMMCNTAIELAPSDAEAAAKVQANMKQLREAFRSRLAEAQKTGELERSRDIGTLAEFLATTAYSAGFLLRAGCSDAFVRRHIRTAISAVG